MKTLNMTYAKQFPAAPAASSGREHLWQSPQRSHSPHRRGAQRGISLFIVIVIVMLSMLLALWASRTSMFNEMIVGNDADYQRAFEAAQALLQDAELDIRGERADGQPCSPDEKNGDICRRTTVDKIPLESQEIGPLLADLDEQTTKCRNGLCAKRTGRQDFWNYTSASTTPANIQVGEVPLEQLTKSNDSVRVGARYGQYTGAAVGKDTEPANPLLADRSADNKGGWYWIEVLPYSDSSKSSGLIVGTGNQLALNLMPNVIYRITALAYGRKPNTMVVLQQTYAQQKRKD